MNFFQVADVAFYNSAEMSDIVKQKRLSHCPLFYRGGGISYAGPKVTNWPYMKTNDFCYQWKVMNGS